MPQHDLHHLHDPLDPGRPLPRLHVLTDTRDGRDPLPDVLAAVRVAGPGGCAVQVRAKEATDREAFALTVRVLEVARPFGVPVLVDDRVDVALAAGADGVHLGATDLPVERVRAVVPARFVIGATARDAVSTLAAASAGADYLGVGPAHATTTKPGLPTPLGPAGIAAVVAATTLPVVAIGGIDAARVPALLAAGAHGVAVVAAVSTAPDPAAAVAGLLAALSPPTRPPNDPPTPAASVVGNGPTGAAS
ncbi:thiamine phosphate synthase [Intrasporangium flavum]|uniref:thiamine phosphate synthase n=1 Tax=Intrasporangium flavum TaxID=1428657 RepID=UPI00096DA4E7|nr:thiamine phosphate synthase [Intrasporangium flavum]